MGKQMFDWHVSLSVTTCIYNMWCFDWLKFDIKPTRSTDTDYI